MWKETGTPRGRRIQERYTVKITLVLNLSGYSWCLMERGRGGLAVLYGSSQLGVSFFEGELLSCENSTFLSVNEILGYPPPPPQKDTVENLHT